MNRRWQSAWIVAVVGAGTAATAYGEYASGTLLGIDVVIGVAGCVLVPLLGRWPVVTALVLAALAAVAPTATPAWSVGLINVGNRRRLGVTAGVAAAGIVTHAVRGLWRPMPGLPYGWWLVLVVFGHVALAAGASFARERREVICSLQDRAERAEAEQGRRIAEARAAERAGLAREMHDVLAHRLSLLATYAGALEYRPDAAPDRLAQASGVVRATAHQALDELRDVISLLRDDDAPGDRPVPTFTDLPALVEESRATGTAVDVTGDLTTAVGGTSGRTAYRVVQEALTNARKHAPGSPVSITFGGTPGEDLVVDIRNPLAPEGLRLPASGTGLVGLTERVRLAGGRLDHHETAGEFRVHARLPWPA